LVHRLRGYNQKNPKTWDENLVYIQPSYNRAVHTSTSKSPFKTCFGYFPPFLLDVFYGKQGGVMKDVMGKELKVDKFVENIRQIHLQVHETLKKSQEMYKA
jgi:hypothetical protein